MRPGDEAELRALIEHESQLLGGRARRKEAVTQRDQAVGFAGIGFMLLYIAALVLIVSTTSPLGWVSVGVLCLVATSCFVRSGRSLLASRRVKAAVEPVPPSVSVESRLGEGASRLVRRISVGSTAWEEGVAIPDDEESALAVVARHAVEDATIAAEIASGRLRAPLGRGPGNHADLREILSSAGRVELAAAPRPSAGSAEALPAAPQYS